MTDAPRLTTLANGLRVVTDAMPGLHSAAVGLWVAAGGRHEREDQNGIAHFLEHMAFKGTPSRSAARIAEEIEDVGGYLNAYTSREMTAYYARVLAADVPLALDVIADIVLNPLFAEADIDTERHVILQEIGQTLDTPDDIVFDWLQEAAYPGQPIGRSILGPPGHVEGFGAADLRGFMAEHYVPGRMILAAAGAVDHAAVVARAGELFGGLAPRPAPAAVPAAFASGERREARDLEQVHLTLAFEAPAHRDPDFHVAQVFATLMGGGMSSRLFQKLREERGLCYSISAQAHSYDDSGLLTVYAGTAAEDIALLATLAVEEFRAAAAGAGEAEVARARAQLRAGLLMGLEGSSSRVERLARMVAIWGHVPPLAETLARIEAVDVGAVRDHARRMLARGAAAMAVTGPIATAPALGDLVARLAG